MGLEVDSDETGRLLWSWEEEEEEEEERGLCLIKADPEI
jgi:hypothetical protein